MLGITELAMKSNHKLHNLVKDCQPFIFHNDSYEKAKLATLSEEFDAPFKTFSIEVANNEIRIHFDVTEPDIFIKCILVNEISPNKYDMFILWRNLSEYYSVESLDKFPNYISDYVKRIVSEFLTKLNNKSLIIGYETSCERIKIKDENNSKKTVKLNKIIHIRNRVSVVSDSETHRQIEWSHRWYVRGHWRSTPGKIGKDRAGNRNIENYTWVTEHEKGPESAPLVAPKLRIVDAA